MSTTTWTRETVARELSRIVAELLGIQHSDVTPHVSLSSLFSGVGSDSLDTIEVLMAIEDPFGIEILDADAEFASCETVADLIDYVCLRLGVR